MRNTVKVFCDINVFQDVIVERSKAKLSMTVLGLVENKKLKGVLASFSIPTLWYLNRRLRNPRQEIAKAIRGFAIVSPTPQMVRQVINNPSLDDLEDDLQYLVAKKAQCNYIITGNTRDFINADIKALTPEEFLYWFSRSS